MIILRVIFPCSPSVGMSGSIGDATASSGWKRKKLEDNVNNSITTLVLHKKNSDTTNRCCNCPIDSICQSSCDCRKSSRACKNCASYNGRCNNHVADPPITYSPNFNSNNNYCNDKCHKKKTNKSRHPALPPLTSSTGIYRKQNIEAWQIQTK